MTNRSGISPEKWRISSHNIKTFFCCFVLYSFLCNQFLSTFKLNIPLYKQIFKLFQFIKLILSYLKLSELCKTHIIRFKKLIRMLWNLVYGLSLICYISPEKNHVNWMVSYWIAIGNILRLIRSIENLHRKFTLKLYIENMFL